MKQKSYFLSIATFLVISTAVFSQLRKNTTTTNNNQPIAITGTVDATIKIDKRCFHMFADGGDIFKVSCYAVTDQNKIGELINAKISFDLFPKRPMEIINLGEKKVELICKEVKIENLPLNQKFVITITRLETQYWTETPPNGLYDFTQKGSFYFDKTGAGIGKDWDLLANYLQLSTHSYLKHTDFLIGFLIRNPK